MFSKSMNMLTKFDGRSFKMHGIISSLQVQFGGNTVSIKFEVVDAPLNYNILPGTWIYTMKVIVSSIFRVMCFPFEDRIVTINQLQFDN